MDDAIGKIRAQKILDSRGNWTVEIRIETKSGISAKGIAPSGASTGIHEAKVIDADNSVRIANKFLQKIIGAKLDQSEIDDKLFGLDKTKGFLRIGGNTAIALSFAVYNALHKKAVEKSKNIFPYPLGNVFGGGKHGGGTDIQEFLICPLKSKTFPDCIERMTDAYHELKKELEKKYETGINDEGAITANIPFEKAINIVSEISERNDCRLGLDVASSNLWNGKKYIYPKMKKSFDAGGQIDFISDIIKTYKLFYVEDALNEEDFSGFSELAKKHGKKCLICGDDLTTTNPERLKTAIKYKSVNSVIVKPNQIGTVSLAREFTTIAKKNKIVPVISHRSAETTDSTISLMAVDWQIPVIKAGVVDVRIAKLDRLLEMWSNCNRPVMSRLT
ncbi:Enolase [uncultured archaeon]|nr:Enolase [uncultured archaeon]